MSSPIRVVPPVAVTDAMLISSTVAEADHPVYSSGTSYAEGDRVIVTAGVHRIYESLASGNVGNAPASSPDHWAEVGPTNRWALFDGSNSTSTIAPSGAMSYTLRQAGGINALAALNVRGGLSVRVRLQHPTLGVIFDRTTDLTSLPPDTGWASWFFGTRTAPPVVVMLDLPAVPGCDLIVDFTGTTDLSVGVLLFGEQRAIGTGMLRGARVGITDYSRKETDAFGNVVLVQRSFAKRASWMTPVLSSQIDATLDYLATLRAVPCLWIGSTQYASTVIFGFYKQMEAVIAYAAVSECSMDIEGLT